MKKDMKEGIEQLLKGKSHKCKKCGKLSTFYACRNITLTAYDGIEEFIYWDRHCFVCGEFIERFSVKKSGKEQ